MRHAALVVLALLVAAVPAQAKPVRSATDAGAGWAKRAGSGCAAKGAAKGAKARRSAARRRSACRSTSPLRRRGRPAAPRSVAAPAPASPVAAPVTAPAAAPLGAPLEAAPAPAPSPLGAAPSPPPAPTAPACDPSPWLGVVAEDAGGAFRFRLTRTCVPAGTVLFQFRNTDLADHNLWAEGVAPAAPERQIVETTPGETVVTASATLAAGQWRLFCAIAGHEAMSRLVDVTPAS